MGKNPTDRGKKGTKKSVLVDGDGGPLGVVIAGANVNDHKLLQETIEAIVVERPEPTAEEPQHLCLDEGYDNPTGREAAAAGEVHAAHRPDRQGEEGSATVEGGHKPRRWVVERTLAWLSQVPGDPGPLRQEGRELPGPDPVGLRPALVSAPPPAGSL